MIKKMGAIQLLPHSYPLFTKHSVIEGGHFAVPLPWISLDETMHVGCKVFEGVVEAVDDGSLVVDDWWDGCELSLRRQGIQLNCPVLPCLHHGRI